MNVLCSCQNNNKKFDPFCNQQSANLIISKWLNTDQLIYWCITKINAPLCEIYCFIDIQMYLKILTVSNVYLQPELAHVTGFSRWDSSLPVLLAGSFAVQITNGLLAGFQRGKRLISLNLFPSNPPLNSSEGKRTGSAALWSPLQFVSMIEL